MINLPTAVHLLVFFQLITSGKAEYSTFTDYFLAQERKFLEKKLQNLEVDTYTHEFYGLEINHEHADWMMRMKNVSKIATCLLKGLDLSPSEAECSNWIKVSLPTNSAYENSEWNFSFNWRPRVLPEDGSYNEEIKLMNNWRKLTNRVLIWKTRQDNWRSLLPSEAREFPQATQALLDNLHDFLQTKFNNLVNKSIDFSSTTEWLDILVRASMIGRLALEYHEDLEVISSAEAQNQTNIFAWIIRTLPDLNGPWNFELLLKSPLIVSPVLHDWPDGKTIIQAEGLLGEWEDLTDDILDWKRQVVSLNRH